MTKLSPMQRDALRRAIGGNGLTRKPGGFWVPTDAADAWALETHRDDGWIGTGTVRALLARNLVLPLGRLPSGSPASVVVNWSKVGEWRS